MMRLIKLSVLAAALSCAGVALADEAVPERGEESAGAPADCIPSRRVRCPTPAEILDAANESARQHPSRNGFLEARLVYAYAPGAIYELYTTPTNVSAVLLEPGEAVTAIAAGDTSRWMVTEAEGGGEREPRAIILVKPQSAGLFTNIVIVTDRRIYLVEARSGRDGRYAAEIAWSYSEQEAAGAAPEVSELNLGYRIRTVRGRAPAWRPILAFDDGRRTWIEFPPNIAASDLPPLFVITPEGAELVNTRVNDRRIMVDRIFDRAELRLGVRAPVIVRIERVDQTGREHRAMRRGERP